MGRLRWAFVRGKRSDYWRVKDDVLILHGRRPGEETDVPVPHLADAVEFDRHVWRLRDKRWVPEAAVLELIAMRDGSRRHE